MTNKLLKYVVYGGLFIIPFVPLVIAKSLFFPFITGKAFAFRLIVEIITLAFVVLAIRDREFRPKYSKILGALAVFMIAMGLSTIFAENSFKAFWSNFERMEGYISLLHFAAYFVVLGTVFKTQQMWNKLIATSLGASAIMCIYSFLQIAGKITINQGGVRVDGTLGNAAYLGIYTVFHIFFAALLFMRYRGTWQRMLLGVVGLMNLIVLYFTATRGSILGLIGGAFISFIYLTLRSEKGDKIRKVAFGGAIALILLVGLFVSIKNTTFVKQSPVLSRFATLSFAEAKTQGRYFIWPMALRGALDRPVFGWGQEGFNYVFNKYYDARMWNQEPWFDRTHNVILDWLVAGGFVGLLAYISIFVALIITLRRADDSFLTKGDKAVVLGMLAAYVFHNLFVFDQISSYILFFTVLAYAHAHAPETQNSVWHKISSPFARMFEKAEHAAIYESIAVLVAIGVVYFAVLSPYFQNKDLMNVLMLNAQGQTGTVADYQKPLSRNSVGFSEALEHLSRAAVVLNSTPTASADLKKGVFEIVDKAFKKQLSVSPNDARYHLFYGTYLNGFGKATEAEAQFAKAIELSPSKQGIYFEEIGSLISQGKAADALPLAKKTYELDTNYFEAKFIYGLTAIAAGNNQLANEIMSTIPREKMIFDDRLVSVLLMTGRLNDIIDIAKARIELDPTNPQHKLTLAAAYLQANRRSEAVAAIQQIIKENPSFKDQGEYYIKEIQAGRNP